eukprot:SAG25_NODE_3244_length_1160_cov_2.246937_2_plen_97_part_00
MGWGFTSHGGFPPTGFGAHATPSCTSGTSCSSNDWHKDLLHCPKIAEEVRRYKTTVVGTSSSAAQQLAKGAVRIYIEEVELHIAYSVHTTCDRFLF